MSWFVCAFTFPNKRQYKIFLVDNLHFMPVIMKSLRLISKKQKIVAHMGSHTLYFLYVHRFSRLTEFMHIQALKRYDAIICEGKMAETLVKELLGGKTPKLYTIINGIPDNHFPSKTNITSPLTNKNILFIGQGPGESRSWYKGLDLMISTFSIAREIDPELTFTIVGYWDEQLVANMLKPCSSETREAIRFVGETSSLAGYINESSLYLHTARGEAYGLTILIAMAYGIPPLISEWTGAKEIVEKVNPELIAPLNPNVIAQRIIWYFNLSLDEKRSLSQKCIEISRTYTEERALNCFKEKFMQMEKDFQFIQ
jgi:glycosyltransferase involved in cell wall biosynthesis